MIPRFPLYDFIAAVIPGIFFLWATTQVAGVAGTSIPVALNGGLAETSTLIALAYVTGLLLQGISQTITENILKTAWGGLPSARWLLADDKSLSASYRERLLESAQAHFRLPTRSEGTRQEQLKQNQELFYLIYNAVDQAKLSERPQLFNAQYGLFRCLLTTFCLLVIIAGAALLIDNDQYQSIAIILILSALGALISYFRVKKRGEDFTKAIYDLFMVGFPPKSATTTGEHPS